MEIKAAQKTPIVNKMEEYSFKGSKKRNTSDNNSEQKPSVSVSPLYYQALNGISSTTVALKDRGRYIISTNIDGAPVEIEMDSYLFEDFFTDSELKPNRTKINQFAKLYKTILDDLTKKNEEEIKFYEEILQGPKKNVIEMQFPPEIIQGEIIRSLDPEVNENQFARRVTSILSGEAKKNLAGINLDFLKKERPQLPHKACIRTIELFELSETPDGFSLDETDKKSQLLDLIHSYENNFNDDEIYDRIAALIKTGRADIDFAIDYMKILAYTPVKISQQQVFETLKYFYSKDSDKRQEIFDTIQKVNTNFIFSESNTHLKDLVECCFDENGKFNSEKSKILESFLELTDTWIDTNMKDINTFPTYTEIAKNIIIDYLHAYSKDTTGKFDGSEKSVNDFFNFRTKKLIIIN